MCCCNSVTKLSAVTGGFFTCITTHCMCSCSCPMQDVLHLNRHKESINQLGGLIQGHTLDEWDGGHMRDQQRGTERDKGVILQ